MLRYIILLTFVVATMQPVSAQDVQVPEELTLKEIFLEPVLPGIRPSLNFFFWRSICILLYLERLFVLRNGSL